MGSGGSGTIGGASAVTRRRTARRACSRATCAHGSYRDRDVTILLSHHFVGTGPFSNGLRVGRRDPPRLLALIAERVVDCGLEVVAETAVPFDNGGLTLVWVLAESHLVLHVWPEQGCATVDLHVCDYNTSNAEKARRLRHELAEMCFAQGSGQWREMVVGGSLPGASCESHDLGGIEQQRKGVRA